MNLSLWVLQVILALHTLMGAVWKFSKSAAETMPSLKAIPPGVWMTMGGLEILVALCLILPAFNKQLGILAPIVAGLIIVEMLAYCGLHIHSGDSNCGPMIYWLVVAAICAFIAYGRLVLKPF